MITSSEDSKIIRYPHPSIYDINYDRMMIGDIWCTTSLNPLSVGIKIATWGFFNSRVGMSLDMCSHVAIVCKIGDQFFLAEAIGSGIQISSCYKYMDPSFYDYSQVCRIKRHARIAGLSKYQVEQLNNQIITIASDAPSYNAGGAVDTTIPIHNVPLIKDLDSPKKLFCSEFADKVLVNCDNMLKILDKPSNQITPKDYQVSSICLDRKDYILKKKI